VATQSPDERTANILDDMGKNFWWKTTGIVVGLGLLVLLSVLVLNRLVYRFGAIAALLIIFGVAMIVAYRHDKKKQQEYEELP
jgi:undecaprenyl pyrophosphate phosphatase UppP